MKLIQGLGFTTEKVAILQGLCKTLKFWFDSPVLIAIEFRCNKVY